MGLVDPRETNMKRVQYDRYGGAKEMYLGDFEPPPLGDGQVRVSVRAAAINPFDWKLRQGAMKVVTGRRFPKAMGTDFAGVVEAVGTKATRFRVGDEVFGSLDFKLSGAFAEAVVADESALAKRPSNLTFAEAAALPIAAATAWVAIVDRAKARTGSRVFINGCTGAVGAFAAQLAASRGARVYGACGPTSRAIARANGVVTTFGYDDVATYALDGKFDAVFDSLGTLGVGQGLGLLKPKGVFVDINPTPGRMLRGLPTRRYKLAFATMGLGQLQAIADLAGEGVLRPTIGSTDPFSDAVAVIAEAEAGLRRTGKAILTFDHASAS